MAIAPIQQRRRADSSIRPAALRAVSSTVRTVYFLSLDMTQLPRKTKMALSAIMYRLYISCCLVVIKSNFGTYAALPKISKSSTIYLRKLDSSVEACFNVTYTGIPKPLLKISKQDNNIVTTSANRKEKYCV